MKHKHADLMLEYAKQAQENECPWMTIKEFEASPEDGIYYVYTDDNEIKISWYSKDQFYADEAREYGRWWITHVMKITIPDPPK